MQIDKAPEHAIDPDSLAALPRSPGVYIFRGEGTLPLYIGKSVDIRSRVLSHLRTPDEANMLAQTKRIDFIETAGEIGALLLEAQMIKTHSPLYNQRLRRIKKLCSLQLVDEAEGSKVSWVDDQTVQPGITPDLFGLFSSRKAAKDKLSESLSACAWEASITKDSRNAP